MYLNNKTKAGLERIIGKSLKEISEMSLDEEINYVEQKTRKSLIFSKKTDNRIYRRGNPLLVRGRICTMQDIDKKISELK